MPYKVARSLYGSLGSLKRNAILLDDDPRITENAKAVKDLEKRKLLIKVNADGQPETDDAGKASGKKRRKSSAE
jgi:hypothetical protein